MADPRLSKVLAEHVAPRWTTQRERAVRDRVDQSIAGRRVSRGLFAVVAGVCTAALAFSALKHAAREQPALAERTERASVSGDVLLALDDGSKVRRTSPDARITPVEVGPSSTTLRLEQGEALFDVTRRSDRRFQVVAPGVTVTVLGTAFRVARSGAGVNVAVERGRVEVTCWDRVSVLSAGERQLCPAAQPLRHAPASPGPSASPSAVNPAPARPRQAASWRALAEEGDYKGAYARMVAEGSTAVRDEPADLLFAADVTRLSGHASEAVPRLERVVRSHAGDSRAPLAAFTLGRTLLDELGRPREAAEAFARVRRLSPSGAMAQDALAREVESWSRAGEADLARERAKQYLERYPAGRRIKAVRYHGGLE